MKRADSVYLAHILDAINQIETYTADLSYDQVLQNRLVQDGVMRHLEIIGIVQNDIAPLKQNVSTWLQGVGQQ